MRKKVLVLLIPFMWLVVTSFTNGNATQDIHVSVDTRQKIAHTWTGKWIAVYEGNSSPTHYECVWSMWSSHCKVGDTRKP